MEGDLGVGFEVDLEGEMAGDFKENSNRSWKGTCCQAQVRSGQGLVQVTAQI